MSSLSTLRAAHSTGRSPTAIVVSALAAMILVAGQVPAQEVDDPDAAVTVTMTNDLKFAPASITVQKGATVVWRNTSDVAHTVTAIPGKASNPANVRLPEGADPFGSGNMQPGATFSHTFTVPGTYRYFCIPHEGAGMVATVRVEG